VTLALGTLAPPGSTTRPVISIADKTVMFRHSVRAVFAVSARTPRRRGGAARGGLRWSCVRDSIGAFEKENNKMQNKSYVFLTAIAAAAGLVFLSLR